MIEAGIYSLAAAIVAFLISSATIPLVKRFALAIRSVDYPGGRRVQAEPIPRMGGVAAVLGLFLGAAPLALLRWDAWHVRLTTPETAALVLALFIIFFCGLMEDAVGLSPLTRFLMQSTAALLVVHAGWSFGVLNLPFLGDQKLGVLAGLISIFWIVGVTNAINLLDGLDGLAGGVVAIIAATLLVLALCLQEFITVLIMAALLGACLGFLRKNWAPAQIYLGDAGSLTLGFVLAVVSIRSALKAPAAIAILVPMLALGLPVIDTLLVMLLRFARRSHAPFTRRFARMFRADRNHLHHLMMGLVQRRKSIVIGIYLIAVLFCSLAMLVALSKNAVLGFILIGLEILVVFAVRQAGLHADALRISLEKRRRVREFLISRTVAQVRKIQV